MPKFIPKRGSLDSAAWILISRPQNSVLCMAGKIWNQPFPSEQGQVMVTQGWNTSIQLIEELELSQQGMKTTIELSLGCSSWNEANEVNIFIFKAFIKL